MVLPWNCLKCTSLLCVYFSDDPPIKKARTDPDEKRGIHYSVLNMTAFEICDKQLWKILSVTTVSLQNIH